MQKVVRGEVLLLTGSTGLLEREPESWAGGAIFLLLCTAAGSVLFLDPDMPRRITAALFSLIAIGGLTLVFVLRRNGRLRTEASRAAAAAVSDSTNVACAVTAKDGCIIGCNAAYRDLAGCGDEAPEPPQLGFRTETAAGPMYRLSRAAHMGVAHQETFEAMPGRKLIAAVSPMKNGETVWWFMGQPETIIAGDGSYSSDATFAFRDFFANAPIGV